VTALGLTRRELKQGFGPQEASKLMAGNYVRVFKKAVADRKAA
jgi:hypothetical protein